MLKRHSFTVFVGLVFVLGLLLPSAGCAGGNTASSPTPTPEPVVLVGAGDIAACESGGDEATAALLDGIAGTVFTAGDNVYQDATASEFANCYDPSWGRHKGRTRPAPGNHEYYQGAKANPYFDYFGAAAGERGKGYYSYDLGAWHIVVLNSNCAQVGGCSSGSPQEQWLRADLAAHPTACTLAYWHHPLFSSGHHGGMSDMVPLWQALYEAGAELIINGHDHLYERFAPQDPRGVADPEYGIRQFTAGMGGKSLYPFKTLKANSEMRNNDTYGVLKLTLHATSYDWEFVPEAGKTFTDRGSGSCHSPRTAPPGSAKINQPLIVLPVADAYVDSDSPGDNFGSANVVRVDASPAREAYLKFEVSGLSGTVTSAKLRIYAPDPSRSGGAVARMRNRGGSAASVTDTTRPAIDGRVLSALGAVSAGQWREFDVTGAVTGNGTVSFGLASSDNDGVNYASRENVTFPPQLVITLAP